MLTITTIFSTAYNKINQRMIKVLRWGKKDVQTATESSPHGIDSNPVKDMIAIYAETGSANDRVIIGYLLKDKLAAVGETRIFATDTDGALQNYIWLKNNGKISFGGEGDHLARFAALKAGFDELKADFNALVIDYNTHTHPGVTAGAGVTGVTTSLGDASNADIDDAKIDDFETP